jgi:hypothetical protein
MPGTLAPSPWFTGLDDDGSPLVGGLLYTYAAGTLTFEPTYTDADLLVPNTNPVVLDAGGRCTLYLSETSYKFVLKRSDGSTVRSRDDIASSSLGQTFGTGEVFNFNGDASAPVTDTTYDAGSTFDNLHAGTGVMVIDSDTLVGSYVLEAMLISDGSLIRAALVNLSDGAPDTPIVEVDSVSVTGERVQSDVIVFPAGGSEKVYGIKTKISAGAGYVWGVKLVRVPEA